MPKYRLIPKDIDAIQWIIKPIDYKRSMTLVQLANPPLVDNFEEVKAFAPDLEIERSEVYPLTLYVSGSVLETGNYLVRTKRGYKIVDWKKFEKKYEKV